MKLRTRLAILLGAIVLVLGLSLSPPTDQTSATARPTEAKNSTYLQTPPQETHFRTFGTTPVGKPHHTAAGDHGAGHPANLETEQIADALPPEEWAFQVLSEFGQLSVTAEQFAELAPVQQTWIKMRRDLAASMAQHEKRDNADAADLQMIDHARDAALRRILGEETFRVWVASRGVNHRAFQSDPHSTGLDERKLAQIYAAIREHDIATATRQYDEQNPAFAGKMVDRSASSAARAIQVAETKVTLGTLLGREPFERMQRQGLFGLPDLGLAANDSPLPAPIHDPANVPSSQNP